MSSSNRSQGEWRTERTAGTALRCENCGAHVTPEFTRVFGDNEDRVYSCFECQEASKLFDGAGAQRTGTRVR
jgi:DNA-directed RNA polymerase subunit RPC12/RpoP